MELLYIWIENDGMTIKDQAFNFSNHLNFKFEKENDLIGTLKVYENCNFIDNFFDESLIQLNGSQEIILNGRIVNVTGIIGENGVGKTNLLNLIINLLTDNLPIGYRFIVVFKDEKNKSIKIFHTLRDFTLNILGSINDFIIESPVEQVANFLIMNYQKTPPKIVDDFKLIFYSPIFDLRDYPPNISNEYKDYIDVSTNALIENDVMREGDSHPDSLNKIELHKFSNVRRQFDMLINPALADMKGINFPKEVKLIFHRDTFNPDESPRNLKFEYIDIFKNLIQLAKDKFAELNSILSSYDKVSNKNETTKSNYKANPNYRKALSDKLKTEFTYNMIENYFHNLNENNYEADILLKLVDIEGTSLFEKASYFFENQKWKAIEGVFVKASPLYTLINNLIDEINFDKYWIEDNANFLITSIEDGISIISEYENYILSIPSKNKKNFISIHWRDISSGEKALIDLYSRIFFAKKRLEEKVDNMKNLKPFIYLIIDEGEIGFHPQWQSQYLYNLISFVEYIFSKYKVQIILTSHSPFIVSDLPKGNLIFLEKFEGMCKVIQFSGEQTFASNIHSILADQFFMKEGVMGKFARTKLNSELKPLLNNNNIDIERLKKIISMIGEPVLRSKLTEILNSKNSLDV